MEQVDRFKGDYMMMVMELKDGAEIEIVFISPHLHPHTKKLGKFIEELNSKSQKSHPKSYITAPLLQLGFSLLWIISISPPPPWPKVTVSIEFLNRGLRGRVNKK